MCVSEGVSVCINFVFCEYTSMCECVSGRTCIYVTLFAIA